MEHKKKIVPEYNERFGIHVKIEAVFTFPFILDTYEVMTKLQGEASRRARALVRVLGCWSVGECSSVHRARVLVLICSSCWTAHEHGHESNFQ